MLPVKANERHFRSLFCYNFASETPTEFIFSQLVDFANVTLSNSQTFQTLNLGWFEAPQSFKSEKLRVTKHQIKKERIALKYEPNYINKNG